MAAQASGFAAKAHRCSFDTKLERYCEQGDVAANATLVLPASGDEPNPTAPPKPLWLVPRRRQKGAGTSVGYPSAPVRLWGIRPGRFPSACSEAKLYTAAGHGADLLAWRMARSRRQRPRPGLVECCWVGDGSAMVRWRSSLRRGAGQLQAGTPRPRIR
jgi:hypothetical protein